MIIDKGPIFRFGQDMKDFGERMGHKKILGIPVLRWCCRPVIILGLAIRDSVMDCPVVDFSGEK